MPVLGANVHHIAINIRILNTNKAPVDGTSNEPISQAKKLARKLVVKLTVMCCAKIGTLLTGVPLADSKEIARKCHKAAT
jgi:hypothetical protein